MRDVELLRDNAFLTQLRYHFIIIVQRLAEFLFGAVGQRASKASFETCLGFVEDEGVGCGDVVLGNGFDGTYDVVDGFETVVVVGDDEGVSFAWCCAGILHAYAGP